MAKQEIKIHGLTLKEIKDQLNTTYIHFEKAKIMDIKYDIGLASLCIEKMEIEIANLEKKISDHEDEIEELKERIIECEDLGKPEEEE